LRRSVVIALLVMLLSGSAAPETAVGQTFLPPVELITGGDDEPKDDEDRDEGGCAAPVLVCAGAQAGGAIAGATGDLVAAGAGAATNAVMGGVVSWAADGAAWVVSEIGAEIDRSTRPAIGSGWFTERYRTMTQLAIALSAVFLLLALGQAIVRQDLVFLLRATFLMLPLAMMLTFAAVTLVETGLAVTDWMAASVLRGFRADVRSAFASLADLLQPSGTSGSLLAPFVLFLASAVTALLGLLVWMELVMREAAIYVAVAFLPLTFAAMVWERTASWSRRLAEWLLAIILSKFTIAVAFAVGAAAIGGAGSGSGGLTALLAGCGVLLVAALTPWALLKLIPFAEQAAGRTLTRGHVSGAASAAPGATTATMATRQLMLKQFAAKGAAARAAPSPRPASVTARPPTQRPGGQSPPPRGPVAKLPDAPSSPTARNETRPRGGQDKRNR
jgi:hypothetical protein